MVCDVCASKTEPSECLNHLPSHAEYSSVTFAASFIDFAVISPPANHTNDKALTAVSKLIVLGVSVSVCERGKQPVLRHLFAYLLCSANQL